MSYRRKLLIFLLAALAGCSTGPYRPPPDVDLNWPPATNAPAPKSVVPPKPAPPPVLPTPTNRVEIVESWVPLDHWCESNGFAAPTRRVADDAITYSFAATNGTMIVKIGSRVAVWRGTDFDLGFAPELINGRPFVYSLDLRKNFQPLLEISTNFSANRAIVIDPGHGGTDAGAKSVFNGHFEKEYTLDLARRLRSILVANGWTVWLTRTNDVHVPLPGRVAFAEQHKPDLFVSLHFNSASPDQEEAGLETYCLTPRGMPSNLTRGYKDDDSLAFPNNNFDADNLQLAFRLHRAVLKVNGHADRGVRRARFLGVLQGQNRPAILMEGGYLSNPREARRIDDPAYRQKVAEALAKALMEDYGEPASSASKPAISSAETNHPPAAEIQGEGEQGE